MNVFYTDPCPVQSARNLDDLRVVNGLRETCQLLSGAVHHWLQSHDHGFRVAPTAEDMDLSWMYAPTHIMSPCAQWVRADRQNFRWLVDHAIGLANEYLLRFPNGSHKSLHVAWRFMANRDCLSAMFPIARVPDPSSCSGDRVAPFRPYDGAANQELGLDFRLSTFMANGNRRPYTVAQSYRLYLRERYRLASREPRWSAPASRPEWSL